MNNIENLISNETLQKRINQLADEINNDYKGKDLIVVCVLKGAFYFFSDLTRKLTSNIQLEFMRVSSYEGENTTGKIKVKLDLDCSIEGKDVLIVDDIIDSGFTTSFLMKHLASKNPKTIKLCVLLDKLEKRKNDMKADYVGFTISNHFVIGYGLDLDEKYRNIPEISCIIKDKNEEEKVKKDKDIIIKQLKNH